MMMAWCGHGVVGVVRGGGGGGRGKGERRRREKREGGKKEEKEGEFLLFHNSIFSIFLSFHFLSLFY